MMRHYNKSFLFIAALLLICPAISQSQTVIFDDGTTAEVPAGHEIYISDRPVFGLARADRQYRFEALLPAGAGDLSEVDGLEVIRSGPLDGIYVDGYTAPYDADGLSMVQRLVDVLVPYNDSILPDGRSGGFSSGYLVQVQFVGLAAKDGGISPDFGADDIGDTLGGIGNTDPWSNDIFWTEAETATTNLGDVVVTGAGDYQVVQAGENQLALRPLDGAISTGWTFFFNAVFEGHHLGIDPVTGVVWYQTAPCLMMEDADQWYWAVPEARPADC